MILDKEGLPKIKNKRLKEFMRVYSKKHGSCSENYKFAIIIWNLAITYCRDDVEILKEQELFKGGYIGDTDINEMLSL